MIQKGYDFLGIAQRAGQVQSGDAAAEAMIKKGKAKLLILAEDASAGTKKHFVQLAEYKNVRWIEAGEKLRLGIALGRSPRSAIAVTDEKFANRLQDLFIDKGQDF